MAIISGLMKGATIEEAFIHFKQNNANKNVKTIEDYDRFYSKFSQTFSADTLCTSVTKLAVEEWLNEIKRLPLSQNTIHGYYKQLNHFLNFLFEYNYTPMFKINKDVKTKPEIKEKIVFSDEDIIKIFDNLSSKNDNLKILVHLLFYTGLRSSDILTIKAEKVDLEHQELSYYSPKRKKFRDIAFHQDLIPILEQIINNEKLIEKTEGHLLNFNKVEHLNRALTRYFTDLEIRSKGYTARTFRKTFITLARSRYNMDATIVKELVGHEHTNTTDRYYNFVTMDAMKSELTKFKRPINDQPNKQAQLRLLKYKLK